MLSVFVARRQAPASLPGVVREYNRLPANLSMPPLYGWAAPGHNLGSGHARDARRSGLKTGTLEPRSRRGFGPVDDRSCIAPSRAG
jgi:hypothetical protein